MSAASNESFPDRLLKLLDHIEYRRIDSSEDFSDIERLRYKAYKAADVLPVGSQSLIDDVDFDKNAYVFGVYYFEELVSTIRLHYVTPDHRVSQSAGVFPDVMDEMLGAGLTLIDPARFAADPQVAAELPVIPYITLRPSIVAAAYFKADRVLQHVRPPHAAFYKRVFYADTLVERRMTEIYGLELTLMSTNTHTVGSKLLKRYPFFDSGSHERRLMFGRTEERSSPSLTVLPSARLVASGAIVGAQAGIDY
ncbi:N-acyl amino acid synthase FeeM domain-containing protein [Agrobacterium sp. ES01]|uniref:N-acyl amino acid synthase FeeM domain-containing protein n=1 Tax=Agrobacterium sp. ES01 TaxID=3420714 RepID=UPI003D0CB5DB